MKRHLGKDTSIDQINERVEVAHVPLRTIVDVSSKDDDSENIIGCWKKYLGN